jgi:sugar/nucleoside kinase (ribokinase family)
MCNSKFAGQKYRYLRNNAISLPKKMALLRVLGMGNALTDVLIRMESDHWLEKWRLPKGSMQLIDLSQFMTLQNELKTIPKQITCGGSAANTMAGLGRLGLKAAFIGKVGSDETGILYEADLRKQGVTPLLIKGNEPSGQSMVFISPEGSERLLRT